MAKWEKVKLGDICDFLNGYAFKSEKYQAKGYRVIRITNVQKGKIIDEDPKFYEENIKLKKFVLKENDILISLTGNVGRVGVVADNLLPAYLNQRVGCVRINNKQVSVNYLYSYMNSDFFENKCIQSAKGIAQKNLSTEWLKEVLIPLPPLEEQKKIAERLDAVSDLLEKQKQLLAEQDNLIKSIFYDMFGDTKTNSKKWELVRLEDVLSIGSSTRVFVDELVSEGIPFYRGTEIGAMAVGEKIIPSLFITSEHYKKLCSRSGRPSIGDLLMPSICPDGRIWQVQTESPFYFKDGRVLWIHFPSHNIFTSMYLRYAMKEKFAVDYHNIASGTTFAELKICALKSLKIMCPPIELQQKFATIVEGIEAQKEKIKSSIAETQTLFASLMAKYFDEEQNDRISK